MTFFEGRTSHGGYSVKNDTASISSKTPKKTVLKQNSVKSDAIRCADMFYEFVTKRLQNFKITKTGERILVPVSKKRIIREFTTMMQADENNTDIILLVMDWYTSTPHRWKFRTVTSFWKHFSILRDQCCKELNPYTSLETHEIVNDLWNRFIWECDYSELESIVGRSLFAIEQVLDAMSLFPKELLYIQNIAGSPSDWVRYHLIDMATSNLGTGSFTLTTDKVKKQIRGIMNRYGRQSRWVDLLDLQVVRTYNRIRNKRG